MSYSLAVPTAFPHNWVKAPVVVNHKFLARISDLELVQQCQVLQPDAKLFAELIRRHQGQVDALLYKLAPEWSDRADLSQEVWIRVYRYLHRLQEAEKFRGWLGRIVTNLFCDELRKRKRLGKIVYLDAPIQTDNHDQISWELPSQLPSPVEKLSTQEFYEKLKVAIADLPESFRQTIILREIQGMSYEEIAELTQVSLGTVKSRIARARARLQQQLQPYLLDA